MDLKKIQRKEVLRFLVGGGSAVLTDYFFYHLLIIASLTLSLSKGISYILGAIVGFIINKLWTFESKQFQAKEIGKYTILYICSAIANMIINSIVLWIFSSFLFAFLCATGVSTIINFLGQKFFVFSKEDKTI